MFGQQGQGLLHVGPGIGVAAVLLGDHPGVLQVAVADVIGGQGEPGAVRLGDPLGDFACQGGQVPGAAVYAQHRVQPVADAHLPRRLPRQHHQPAHAGGRARRLFPVGFLVADGGQQAPVETELVRGAHEIRFQFRQYLVIAVDEAARFHVIEAVRERVDLLKQAGKLPAVPDAVVELPDCPDQGVIAPGPPDGPAQGFGGGQVEGRPEFRQGDARPDHFVGRRHRVEDLAVLDHLQQLKAVLVLVQHQVEIGITEAQALEVLLRKGIAGNMQLVGGNVCRR